MPWRNTLRTVDKRTLEVSPRKLVVRIVPYRAWIATTILFLLVLPFSQLGKSILDSYVSYSGTVVDEGFQYDYLGGESDPYIVIQDSRGDRTRRYVSLATLARVQLSSYVEKKRGFGETPLRPGQKDPRDR